MAGRGTLQSRSREALLLPVLAASILALAADEGPLSGRQRLDDPAVVGTAQGVVAAVSIGWCLMCFGPRGQRPARRAWTIGVLLLFAHVPLAFGRAHGWSHAAAVDHVREVGGFGGGIAANYLFAVVWAGDVAWWWVSPAGRARRPRWAAALIHGFLGFIVLNATVIFGAPARREGYGVFFAVLVLAAVVGRWSVRRRR